MEYKIMLIYNMVASLVIIYFIGFTIIMLFLTHVNIKTKSLQEANKKYLEEIARVADILKETAQIVIELEKENTEVRKANIDLVKMVKTYTGIRSNN